MTIPDKRSLQHVTKVDTGPVSRVSARGAMRRHFACAPFLPESHDLCLRTRNTPDEFHHEIPDFLKTIEAGENKGI